ncbi:MAG: EamA family transporter [Rhodobacter sp.]|nr:EamA family transporter [Rhodobacter sp.]
MHCLQNDVAGGASQYVDVAQVVVLGAIDLGLSASLAAFITALQPIMTGVLSSRLTGERVALREWAGLGLGLAAVAIVIGDGIALGGSVIAYDLPFLAVISITVASLIDRSATVEGMNSAPLLLVTFWHGVASLAVLAPMAIGLEGLQAEWNANLVFAVVWLARVISLAAYGLMFVLLRRLSAPRVASLTYLSPPVTMVMAWMLFGETLTLAGLVGLGIAAASVGLTLTPRRPDDAGTNARSRAREPIPAE